MRNALSAPAARQPRGLMRVNGQGIPGWIDFEVDNNTYYQADVFRVRLATSLLPPDYGPNWWSQQDTILVELFAGFPANPENFTAADLQLLIYGQVDDVTYDPASTLIELGGRDLTARLIETKGTVQFSNLKSSEIATTLAQRHGLTATYVVPTTVKAGSFYSLDHVQLSDQRSDWDLLTYLAQREDYSVYVQGLDLHFEPKTLPTADPYVLQWTAPGAQAFPTFSGKSIKFSRNLTLAKDVIVEVRGTNQKTQRSFIKRVQASHTKNKTSRGASQPYGQPQVYSFVVPKMDVDEALKFAYAKLAEITRHEKRFSATLPADNVLRVTDIVQVTGTGTDFDQLYYPDSIVRSMSLDTGYSMTINAKNHSPESTVIA